MREYLEKYEEIIRIEKNRDRNEYRTCQICKDASNLTKSQKEWPHVQSIGRIKQVRIPSEKDSHGNDVTPSKEEFWKKAPEESRLILPEEGTGKDVQCTALISDLILTAEELGKHKKNALVNREPAPSCAGRYIQGRSFASQKVPKQPVTHQKIRIQHLTPGDVRDRSGRYNDRNDGLLL